WQGNGDELKNASKLLVGPGQGCIFVYEGRVKAVLNETGLVNFSDKFSQIPCIGARVLLGLHFLFCR
ncbi:hypothetical protein BMR02_09060, partial [Methylococcaceae bacterium HT1]